MKVKRTMVEPDNPVSMRRQCELLRLNRSGLYYEPVATAEEELAMMKRIDELHLKYPFYGSRKLALELRDEGRVREESDAWSSVRTLH